MITVDYREDGPESGLMQNLCDLLGVRPDDNAETIKKAFREAAKASHPDHHGDDPQAAVRFRQSAPAPAPDKAPSRVFGVGF
jgi:DnaJ-class molecular chaperone